MRWFVLLLVSVLFCSPVAAETHLRLATTTSTESSGLLDVLLPPFEQANDCKVDVIAVGTGKALKLGEAGDVDVVLVHARLREDAFVEAGFGVNRRDVMANDFVIVGAPQDKAVVKGMADADLALEKIALNEAIFVSRGDQSGTHTREKQLWTMAGLKPMGDWYLEAGRGMGEVLTMANERQGYTLTDRGTYIAYQGKVDLEIMVEGDERLFNPYGVIAVNPKLHPHVQFDLTMKFINYLVSPDAQQRINAYEIAGQQLFFATARENQK